MKAVCQPASDGLFLFFRPFSVPKSEIKMLLHFPACPQVFLDKVRHRMFLFSQRWKYKQNPVILIKNGSTRIV